jgi:hypothetical protein
MPYINIDITDDFYDELNRYEKKELIRLLKKDGLLDSKRLVEVNGLDVEEIEGNLLDYAWVEMMNKINKSRYQLTTEQETILINLVKSL